MTFAEVTPIIGEPLRYRVASATRPDLPYVVDLSEHSGSGSCRCPDFLCRREPAIAEGKPLFTRATSCKHIQLARDFFTRTTLTEIAKLLHPAP